MDSASQADQALYGPSRSSAADEVESRIVRDPRVPVDDQVGALDCLILPVMPIFISHPSPPKAERLLPVALETAPQPYLRIDLDPHRVRQPLRNRSASAGDAFKD